MKTFKIGRSSSNDIVINNSSVSGQHALLTMRDGYTYLRDLNSTNGTFVNGKKIDHEITLKPGDMVQLGNQIFDWNEGIKAYTNATKISAPSPLQIDSVADKRIIGRDQNCSIVVAKDEVSRNHAFLIKKQDGTIWVYDNQSTNGTFVNGSKVIQQELHRGDCLSVANKYNIDWEKEFGYNVPSKHSPVRSHSKTTIIAAIVLVLIVLGVVCGLILRPWTPNRVYSTYKSSVVMIFRTSAYELSYKGESIQSLPIIGENYLVEKVTGTGTGFFISEDGKIMTNAHVISNEFDPRVNVQEIRDKAREELSSYVYAFYLNKRKYLSKSDIEQLSQLFEIAKNVDVSFKMLDLRCARNDTHVQTLEDCLPCSIIKTSNDLNLDVAILQLNTKKTPEDAKIVDIYKPSKPNNMKLGNPIYTIGFPNSFTFGSTEIGLEANNQSGEITQECGEYQFGHNIQIMGGASGSPIFDKYGHFAGLIVSGWERNGINMGYNYGVLPYKATELAK